MTAAILNLAASEDGRDGVAVAVTEAGGSSPREWTPRSAR